MLTSQSVTTAAIALFVFRRMASSSPLDFRAAVDSVAQHNHAHRSLPGVKLAIVTHFYPLIYSKIHSAF
jgi:hypothetical protein